jgi:hypothetical protein
MPQTSAYRHAAEIFNADELLMALVAERLDRLADRMVYRGHTRLGVYGSMDHVDWLRSTIEGMSAFPITAFIAGPDRTVSSFDEHEHEDTPLIAIDNPRIADFVDTVLIADDKFEEDMYRKALRWLPPGIIVHRLYERLGIGRQSLLRASIDRRPKAPRVVVNAEGKIVSETVPA